MTARRVTDGYRITTGDGRSTEELVEAGEYEYAHSCLISENFPARHFEGKRVREIVLLEFDHDVASEEAIAAAGEAGLERPMYEDALISGSSIPMCSVSARSSSSMTPGLATSAAATWSVSGVTPAAASWVSKDSTTSGTKTTASRLSGGALVVAADR